MPRAVVDPSEYTIACVSPSSSAAAFLAQCGVGRCELVMTEHLFERLEVLLTRSVVLERAGERGAVDFLDDVRKVAEVRPEPLDTPLGLFDDYLIAVGRVHYADFVVSRRLVGTPWARLGVQVISAATACQQC